MDKPETKPPKIMGREFRLGNDGRWSVPLGILDIILTPHSDGTWEWAIGSSSSESPSLAECLDDLGRELRFLRRELGLDIHQQTGIDAYAFHLGRQASNGLILEHETKWLEEYDRRRIIERKP